VLVQSVISNGMENTNTGGEHVDSMAVVVNGARYLVATPVKGKVPAVAGLG
jgi:hypothetical protein